MTDLIPELDKIRSLHYDMEMGMRSYDDCEVHDELKQAIKHMENAINRLQELRDYYNKKEDE